MVGGPGGHLAASHAGVAGRLAAAGGAAWLLAFAVLLARQLLLTARQLRERAQLRSVFGGYVSPGVMRRILDGELRPTLGGERRYCCVMFSDIRGYTTRSERSTPRPSPS